MNYKILSFKLLHKKILLLVCLSFMLCNTSSYATEFELFQVITPTINTSATIQSKTSNTNELGTPINTSSQLKQAVVGDVLTFYASNTQYSITINRRKQHDNGDVSLIGSINNNHDVIITRGENGSFAIIYTDDGIYKIQQNAFGERLITPDDISKTIIKNIDEGGIVPKKLTSKSKAKTVASISTTASTNLNTTDATAIINIMVFWGPELEVDLGANGVQTQLNYFITYTNQAFISSKIKIELNLVYSKKLNHANNISNSDTLAAMRANDGVFDVATLRDTYNADLVGFIRDYETEHGSCGIAYLLGSNGIMSNGNKNNAYFVASVGRGGFLNLVSCPDLTFAHEVGHNLGSAHDHSNSSGVTPIFNYSFGHDSSNFATIMSYDSNHVQRFSNPNINCFASQPCGVDGGTFAADNARGFNNIRFDTSSFYIESPSIGLTVENLGEIIVDWNNLLNISYYQLYRSMSLNDGYNLIYSGENTTYTDTSVRPNTIYYYRIESCVTSNSNICSDFPTTASATSLNDTYKLSLIVKNGTVTYNSTDIDDCGANCLQSYAKSSVTITAVADNNYTFYNWSGNCEGNSNPLTVTFDTNKTCQANFVSPILVDYLNNQSIDKQLVFNNNLYNFYGVRDVKIIGDNAYLASLNSNLRIIDITTPTMISTISNYINGSFGSYAVEVQNNIAYMADVALRFNLINVTTPTTPIVESSIGYNTIRNIEIIGNTAFLSHNSNGLSIIDVYDAQNPFFLSKYNVFSYAANAYDTAVVGNIAYMAYGVNGLVIIDVSNLNVPTFISRYDTSDARGIKVVGNIAYLADGDGGLKIIDITTPSSPSLLATYDTSNFAHDVEVVGNIVYLADGGGGLKIINVSSPSTPSFIGSRSYGNALDVEVVGNTVFLADYNNGLQIVNLQIIDRYQLSVNAVINLGNIIANGIDCGTDCDEYYDNNAVITLTANANNGFVFNSWSGDCQGTSNPLSLLMNSNKFCSANFALDANNDNIADTINTSADTSVSFVVNLDEGLFGSNITPLASSFTLSGITNGGTFTVTAIGSNNNLATLTFTPQFTGTDNLTIVYDGIMLASRIVITSSGMVSQATSSVLPSNIVNTNVESIVSFLVVLKDSFGNNITAIASSFTLSGITNGGTITTASTNNNIATLTFTPQSAGADTLTITYGGVLLATRTVITHSIQADINNSTITGDATTNINADVSITFIAILKDSFSNNITAIASSFTLVGITNGGTFVVTGVNSNTATLTFTPQSIGTDTLTIAYGGVLLATRTVITNSTQADINNSTVLGSATTIITNTTTPVSFLVSLKDSFGNNVNAIVSSFTLAGITNGGTVTVIDTNNNLATLTFTPQSVGTDTLTITYGGVLLATITIITNSIQADANNSSVSGGATTIITNTTTPVSFLVSLYDVNNISITAIAGSFTLAGVTSGGTFTVTAIGSNNNLATLTFIPQFAGTDTLTIAYGGVLLATRTVVTYARPSFSLATNTISLNKNASNTIYYKLAISNITGADNIAGSFSVSTTGNTIFTTNPAPVVSFSNTAIYTNKVLSSTPANANLYFTIIPDATGIGVINISLQDAFNITTTKSVTVTLTDAIDSPPIISQDISTFVNNTIINTNGVTNSYIYANDIAVFGGSLYFSITASPTNAGANFSDFITLQPAFSNTGQIVNNRLGAHLAIIDSQEERNLLAILSDGTFDSFLGMAAADITGFGVSGENATWTTVLGDFIAFDPAPNSANNEIIAPGRYDFIGAGSFADGPAGTCFRYSIGVGVSVFNDRPCNDRGSNGVDDGFFELPSGLPALYIANSMATLTQGSGQVGKIATLSGFDLDGDNIVWSGTSTSGGTITFSVTNTLASTSTVSVFYQVSSSFAGTNTSVIVSLIANNKTTNATININVVPGASANDSSFTLSSNSTTVGNNINATITILDFSNNPIAGNVTFTISNNGTASLSTTSQTGVYLLSVSNTISGTTTITIAVDGVTIGTQNINFNPDTALASTSIISGNVTNILIAGLSISFDVQLRDRFANNTSGSNITTVFSNGKTSYGSFTITNVNINTGSASITYNASKAGTDTMVISVNGTVIASRTITTFAGKVDKGNSTITGNATTNIIADNSITFTAILKDSFANNITAIASSFTLAGVTNSGTFTVTDTNNNLATLTFTPQLSGTDNLTIVYDGIMLASRIVITSSGMVSQAMSSVLPSNIVNTNVESIVSFLVVLKDSFGNNITAIASSFTLSGITNGGTITTANTNNNTATLTFTPQSVGIDTLTIIYGGVLLATRTVITNSIQADANNSSVLGSATTIITNTTTPVSFLVSLKDSFGNNVNAIASSFTLSGITNGGTITVTETNNNLATITFTPQSVGTDTLTITYGGVLLATITIITNNIQTDANNSSVSGNAIINTDTTTPVSFLVSLYDVNNVGISAIAGSFTLAGVTSGGTFTVTAIGSNNNLATLTFTPQLVGTDTLTIAYGGVLLATRTVVTYARPSFTLATNTISLNKNASNTIYYKLAISNITGADNITGSFSVSTTGNTIFTTNPAPVVSFSNTAIYTNKVLSSTATTANLYFTIIPDATGTGVINISLQYTFSNAITKSITVTLTDTIDSPPIISQDITTFVNDAIANTVGNRYAYANDVVVFAGSLYFSITASPTNAGAYFSDFRALQSEFSNVNQTVNNRLGAHLAIIDSQEERNLLATLSGGVFDAYLGMAAAHQSGFGSIYNNRYWTTVLGDFIAFDPRPTSANNEIIAPGRYNFIGEGHFADGPYRGCFRYSIGLGISVFNDRACNDRGGAVDDGFFELPSGLPALYIANSMATLTQGSGQVGKIATLSGFDLDGDNIVWSGTSTNGGTITFSVTNTLASTSTVSVFYQASSSFAGTTTVIISLIANNKTTNATININVAPSASANDSSFTLSSNNVSVGNNVNATITILGLIANNTATTLTIGNVTFTITNNGTASLSTTSQTGIYLLNVSNNVSGTTTITIAVDGATIGTQNINFNSGTALASTSIISGNVTNTLIAGLSISFDVQLRDRFANNTSGSSITAVFSNIPSYGSFTITNVNINTGSASITYNASKAGIDTMVISVNGTVIASRTITTFASKVDKGNSTITGNATTNISADNSITFTAILKDSFGNNVTAIASSFTFTGVTNSGTITVTNTNTNSNIATLTFTQQLAGTDTLTIAYDDVVLATRTIITNSGRVNKDNSTITGNATTNISADVSITFTVILKDSFGNNITVIASSFTLSGITNSGTITTANTNNNIATLTFTPQLVGTDTLTITYDGVLLATRTVITSFGRTNKDNSTITDNASTNINTSNSIIFTVILKDRFGNNIPAIASSFTLSGITSGGTITTANTNNNIATLTFTPQLVGTDTLTITYDGVLLATRMIITNNIQFDANNSSVSGNTTTNISADVSITFTVILKDRFGNNIPVIASSFTFTGVTSGGTITTANTNNNIATLTFTPQLVGTDTLTIAYDNIGLATRVIIINSGRVNKDNSTITGNATTNISADVSITFTVILKDSFGNNILAIASSFTFTGITNNGTITATNTNNIATLTFTPQLVGTDTLIIAYDNVVLATRTIITSNGIVNKDNSTITGNASTNIIAGNSITFTATLKDSFGNNITAIASSFTLSGITNGGTFTVTSVNSNIATLTFTPQSVGTDTLTITYDDVVLATRTVVTYARPSFTLATNTISLHKNASNTIRYQLAITDITDLDNVNNTFGISTTGNTIFTTNPAPVVSFATNAIVTTMILSSTPTTANLYFTIIPDTIGTGVINISLQDIFGNTTTKLVIVTVSEFDSEPVITNAFDSRLLNVRAFGGSIYANSAVGGNVSPPHTAGDNASHVADFIDVLSIASNTHFAIANSTEENTNINTGLTTNNWQGLVSDKVFTGSNSNADYPFNLLIENGFGSQTYAQVTADGVYAIYPGFYDLPTWIQAGGGEDQPGNRFSGNGRKLRLLGQFLFDEEGFGNRQASYEFPNGFTPTTTITANTIIQGSSQAGKIATLSGFDLDGDNIVWSGTSTSGGTITFSVTNTLASTSTVSVFYQASSSFAGTTTVIVSLTANNKTTNATINITIIPVASANDSSFTLSSNSTTVGNNINATITILDFSNNPIAGNVTFTISNNGTASLSTTSQTGVYLLSVSNTISGTTTITIAVDGVTIGTQNINFNPGTALASTSIISGNVTNTLIAGLSISFDVQLRDTFDNNTSGSIVVDFNNTPSNIIYGSFTITNVNINTGSASITYNASKAGTDTMVISVNGTVIASRTITTFAGKVDKGNSTITGNATTNIIADNSITFTAILKDSFANNITAIASSFTLAGVTNSGTFTVTDTNNNLATLTFTPQLSGTDNLTIVYDGIMLASRIVITSSGMVSQAMSSVLPSNIVNTNVESIVSFLVVLKDSFGNNITAIASSFTLSGITNGGTITTANTNNNTATLTFTPQSVGIDTLTIIYGGVLLATRTVITNSIQADANNSSVLGSATTIITNTTTPVSFLVSLKDSFGNNVNAIASSFTLAGVTNGGTITVTETNNNLATITFTPQSVGTDTLTITYGGVLLATITIITNNIQTDANNSSVSGNAIINTDTTTPVSFLVSLYDVNNVGISAIAGSFTLAGVTSGGTFTVTAIGSNNNLATLTFTPQLVGTDTLTIAYGGVLLATRTVVTYARPSFTLATNTISLNKNASNTIYYKLAISNITGADNITGSFSVSTTGNTIFTTNPAPVVSFSNTAIYTNKVLSSTATTANLYFTIIPDATGTGVINISLQYTFNTTTTKSVTVTVIETNSGPVITNAFDNRLFNVSVFGGSIYADSALGTNNNGSAASTFQGVINDLGGHFLILNSSQERTFIDGSIGFINSWYGIVTDKAISSNDSTAYPFNLLQVTDSATQIYAQVTADTVYSLYPGFYDREWSSTQPSNQFANGTIARLMSQFVLRQNNSDFGGRKANYEFPNGFTPTTTITANTIIQGSSQAGKIATLSGFDLDGDNVSWSGTSANGGTVTFSQASPNSATSTTDVMFQPSNDFAGDTSVVVSLTAGTEITSATINITIIPVASASDSSFTLSSNTATVGNNIAVTITIMGRNNDNSLTSAAGNVTFTINNNGTGSLTTTSQTGTYLLSVSNNTTGVANLDIAVDGAFIGTQNITFNPDTVLASTSIISGNVTNTLIAGLSISFDVQLRDRFANNTSGSSITAVFSNIPSYGSFTITNVNINTGSASITYNASKAGIDTMVISVNGTVIASRTITTFASKVDKGNSTITGNATTNINTSNSITFTAILKDRFGNNITAIASSFTFTGITSGGTFTVTDINSNIATLTFTQQLAGTDTLTIAYDDVVLATRTVIASSVQADKDNSSVSGSTATININTSNLITFTVILKDSLGNNITAIASSFTFTGITTNGTITVTDVNSNIAILTFTPQLVGTDTLIIIYGGVLLATRTIITHSIQVDINNSTITGNATTNISADVSITFTAILKDSFGNNVTAIASSFTFTGVTNSGTITVTNTNTNSNIATLTFTQQLAGTDTLTIAYDDVVLATRTIITNSGRVNKDNSTITGNATTNISADVSITFTVILKDSFGNNITVIASSFTLSGITNSGTITTANTNNNIATLTFTPQLVGTDTLTITYDGVLLATRTVITSFGRTNKDNSTITDNASTNINTSNSIIFTVILKDRFGNNIPAIASSFTLSGITSGGTITTANTNNNIATLTFTPQLVGTDTLTITYDGVLLATRMIITNNIQFDANNSSVSGNTTTNISADVSITFTVILKDRFGNNIPAIASSFTFTGVTSGGTITTANTNNNIATLTFTPQLVGTDTLTIAYDNIGLATRVIIINSGRVNKDNSTITGNATTNISADVSITFTVILKDSFGNNILAIASSFTFTGITNNGTITATNTNNIATLTFTPQLVGTDTLIIAYDNVVLATRTIITSNGIVNKDNSTITGNASTNIIAGNSITFTATLKDSFGNNITAIASSFTLSGITNNGTFTVTNTNNNIATLTFTPQSTGTDTLTITYGDIVLATRAVVTSVKPSFTLATNIISLHKNASNTIRYQLAITDITDLDNVNNTFGISTTGNTIFTTNPAPVVSFATNAIVTTMILSSTPTTANLYFTIIPDTIGTGFINISLQDIFGNTTTKLVIVTVSEFDSEPVITNAFDSRLQSVAIYGGHLYAHSNIAGNGDSNAVYKQINTELNGYFANINSIEEENVLNSLMGSGWEGLVSDANVNNGAYPINLVLQDNIGDTPHSVVASAGNYTIYPGFYDFQNWSTGSPNTNHPASEYANGFLLRKIQRFLFSEDVTFQERDSRHEFPNGFAPTTTITANLTQGNSQASKIATLSGFDLDGDNLIWSAIDISGNSTITFSTTNILTPTSTVSVFHQVSPSFAGTTTVIVSLTANNKTTNATINITIIPVASANDSSFTLSSNSTTVSNSVGATITILDFSNNPIAGNVTFTISNNGTASLSTTSQTGVYLLSVSNTISGTTTITIAVDGATIGTQNINFNPGTALASTSIISGNVTNTLIAGLSISFDVQLRDTFDNNTSGSIVVDFNNTPSNIIYGSFTITNVNINTGSASITYNASKAGTDTMVISVNGTIIASRTITTFAGKVDKDNSTITGNATTNISADNSITFTVILKDRFGNNITAIASSFTFTGVTNNGTFTVTNTNNNIATLTFTPQLVGTDNLTIAYDGVLLATRTIITSNGRVNKDNSTITGNATTNIIADNSIIFTATLKDSFGNNITAIASSFTFTGITNGGTITVTDTNNNIATLTFTPQSTGTDTLTITYDDVLLATRTVITHSIQADINNSTITGNAITNINTSNSITFTAILKDSFGNNITAIASSFTFTGITSGGTITVTDTNNNLATLTFTPQSAGTDTLTIAYGGIELATRTIITHSIQVDINNSTITDNASTNINTSNSITFTAILKDSFDNNITAIASSFTFTGITSGGTITVTDVNSNIAILTFTPQLVGTDTLIIAYGGIELATRTIITHSIQADINNSTITGNASTNISADVSITFTVILKDSFGNNITVIASSFTLSGITNSGTITTANTNNNIATLTFTPQLVGTDTLTIAYDGVLLATRVIITNSGRVNKDNSTITGNASTNINTSNSIIFTAILKDRFGNNIPAIASSFTLSGITSGGTITTANTNNNIATLTFTPQLVGTDTLTITYDGVLLATRTIIIHSVKADINNSSVSGNTTTNISADVSITFTVILKDRFGNNITAIASSFTFTGIINGGTITTANTNNNIATLTFTPQLIGTDTLTITYNNVVLATRTVITSFGRTNKDNSTITDNASTNINTSNSITFTVILKDRFGNNIPAIASSFTLSGITNGGTITVTGVSNNLATLTFIPQLVGTDTLIIAYDDVMLATRTVITHSIQADINNSTITGNATTNIIADNSIIFTVILKDRFGNNITAIASSFTFTGITRGGTITVTDINSNIATLTFTQQLAGTDTLTIAYDDVVLATRTIIVQASVLDNILLTVMPTAIIEASTVSITLVATLRDSFNNIRITDTSTTTFKTSSATILAFNTNGLAFTTINAINGIATLTFTVSNTSIGVATITAYVAGIGATTTITVEPNFNLDIDEDGYLTTIDSKLILLFITSKNSSNTFLNTSVKIGGIEGLNNNRINSIYEYLAKFRNSLDIDGKDSLTIIDSNLILLFITSNNNIQIFLNTTQGLGLSESEITDIYNTLGSYK